MHDSSIWQREMWDGTRGQLQGHMPFISHCVCMSVCAYGEKNWIKNECLYKVVFLHNVNETKQKPYFLSLNSLSQSLRVPNLHVLHTSLFLNNWSCMSFSLHATHAVYSSYINMIKETTQTKKKRIPKPPKSFACKEICIVKCSFLCSCTTDINVCV